MSRDKSFSIQDMIADFFGMIFGSSTQKGKGSKKKSSKAMIFDSF